MPALAGVDGVPALPPPDAAALAVARGRLPVRLLELHARPGARATCSVTSVFLVPLVALVVLRYVRGRADGRALVVRLGPLLALQLLFVDRGRVHADARAGLLDRARDRRRAGAPPAARHARSSPLARLVSARGGPDGAVRLLPAHRDSSATAIHPQQALRHRPPELRRPDEAHARRLAAGRTRSRSTSRATTRSGARTSGCRRSSIVALFAWRRRRTAGGRFLARVVPARACIADARVRAQRSTGTASSPLPWEHVGYRPLFNNVLPRQALALRRARRRGDGRALGGLARAAASCGGCCPRSRSSRSLPVPGAGHLGDDVTPCRRSSPTAAYRSCLAPGENILPLPGQRDGDADLWQVASGFRFTMAGGYVTAGPPAGVRDVERRRSWVAARQSRCRATRRSMLAHVHPREARHDRRRRQERRRATGRPRSTGSRRRTTSAVCSSTTSAARPETVPTLRPTSDVA